MDLIQSLQNRDLGHLRIIAELWGIELDAPDARVGMRRLTEAILKRQRVEEMIVSLPEDAQRALDDLLQHQGSLPWSLFSRRFGPLREMGPGRRDRERPYAQSPSPAEMLWYRALVARDFLDTSSGPEEFAYVPDDLLALLPSHKDLSHPPLGRPASPVERTYVIPATDAILDHACTLLAALRLELDLTGLEFDANSPFNPYPLSPIPLMGLLSAANLLDDSGLPRPEPTRIFLEAPRGEALAMLARAWLASPDFNELRQLPGLIAEGEWQNDPLRSREAVINFLTSIPREPYWSLPEFIADVRQTQPDFQRPSGDYDSWFLREELSGEFLRGFQHWDKVDGALLRYMLCGPLHWLGILDLASPAPDKAPAAFHFSEWSQPLLSGSAPTGLEVENASIKASSEARLAVPRRVPRSVRYQIARFSAWEGENGQTYLYRLTPHSLERARQQGLKLNHLLALLRRYAHTVPPSLVKALERWDEHGTEARLEQALVLRLRSPELLQSVRSSRAARFLGDPLGPTAIIVKPGAWEKVLAILAELGYLGETIFTDE
jgi:hypothetical protein